jgi:HK97 gp10 family phage protein
MKEAEQVLVRAARKNTPVDTGALRNSLKATISAHSDRITGVIGSNLKYAMAVEKGTRPHWPPLQAIEPWARRHGLVAFLVTRAISRRGTKGHHMLENALEDNRRRIIRFFEDYNRKLTRDAN